MAPSQRDSGNHAALGILVGPELPGVREVEEVSARLGRVDLHVLHVELGLEGEGVAQLVSVCCMHPAPHQKRTLRGQELEQEGNGPIDQRANDAHRPP